ncbi:hypothetical protein MN186_05550, partial [Aliiroseovarius sp. N1F302]|nr:hypothetical protein [Aliiroseovarius sediminis]
APGTPGLYELRYVLETGRRTLARASVEVVESEVGIRGPAKVRAGTDVDVSWSSTINGRDFITIVPAGAEDSAVADHKRAGSATETRLRAPDDTGLYEIRYVLENGRRMLASTPLEVVGEDAPLDVGAGLSVPKTAAPGETITVTWTGGSDSADQRISLAGKEQADFGWIAVFAIGEAKTMDIIMSEKPGLYEIRYLDISAKQVLGRAVVEVK